MILRFHLQGAVSQEVDDEIRQEPLSEAIQAEAENIVDSADPTGSKQLICCEFGSSPRCPRH